MIILDTNVVSELMRRSPAAAVVSWLDRQASSSVWLTSITVFESRFGLALLPEGRRRKTLVDGFERLLAEDLDHRILSFDAQAAALAASIGAARQRLGQPVDMRDTQIAGIAVARRATIATRNLARFRDLPIPVISPWH